MFAVVGPLSAQAMDRMGCGPAAAVPIDATVVRAVPPPSATPLPGERDRRLPARLHRPPDLSHGRPSPPVGAATALHRRPAPPGVTGYQRHGI
ncbi:hypothetical protein ACF9IK_26790 [Kitasatospora hibisci]|uniref:hypothetical protein n=1 Tax=Kitasatospora hibisci TaxID=3369522 RepID=UPI003754FE1F